MNNLEGERHCPLDDVMVFDDGPDGASDGAIADGDSHGAPEGAMVDDGGLHGSDDGGPHGADDGWPNGASEDAIVNDGGSHSTDNSGPPYITYIQLIQHVQPLNRMHGFKIYCIYHF